MEDKQFENFRLRKIRDTDAEKYFRLIEGNRSRLEDFFAGTVAKTRTFADTRGFILDIVEKAANKTYFPFVVIDNESGNFIGFVDVKNIDWNLPKAELGCFIDAAYAGRGISQKALNAVIDHLFNDLGFNKLFLRTHVLNTSARMLAEKCGFEVEGVIRSDYKTTKGQIVDLMYYGRLGNEALAENRLT